MGQQLSTDVRHTEDDQNHALSDSETDRRYGPLTLCLSPITSHDLGDFPTPIHQLLIGSLKANYTPSNESKLTTEPLTGMVTPPHAPQEKNDSNTASSANDESPLVSLPLEILYRIIEIVYYDENSASINANLESFSKTIPLLSRKINQLSLCFLYKYAVFNRPHAFDKFLRNLERHETIGRYVEYMDFLQFTLIGLGRTGRMNMEIQMVTSTTIERALSLCPFLLEFLASENIQDDISVGVLDYLFNHLEKIQALDFCGALLELFVQAFNSLSVPEEIHSLTKLSFHDCSSLPLEVYVKLLPKLVNLRRLDLNHSHVTSTALYQNLLPSARLTHLSLARCSKLTTKDLIFVLTKHPALTAGTLEWLNLQIDTNVVLPLLEAYLLYTVQQLVAPNLQYLNLGGMPVTSKVLSVIKAKFPRLTSLTISHSNIAYDDLLLFLRDVPSLRFLDCTGVKCLNKFNLINLLRINYNSELLAIEFDYKTLFELTSGGTYMKVTKIQTSFIDLVLTPHVWKFYDNEGRRAWIYKIEESDPESKQILASTGKSAAPMYQSNLVYYDLETGNKIVTKVKKPDFLKYALRKINCLIGYHNLKSAKRQKSNYSELVWPVEFSQRGIYNYYSLNVK